jgi:hypothetical protein
MLAHAATVRGIARPNREIPSSTEIAAEIHRLLDGGDFWDCDALDRVIALHTWHAPEWRFATYGQLE